MTTTTKPAGFGSGMGFGCGFGCAMLVLIILVIGFVMIGGVAGCAALLAVTPV